MSGGQQWGMGQGLMAGGRGAGAGKGKPMPNSPAASEQVSL